MNRLDDFLAVQTRRVAGGMHQLMEQGAVVELRRLEQYLVRHRHLVEVRIICRPVTILNDFGLLGHIRQHLFAPVNRRERFCVGLGQQFDVLALLDVEHAVVTEIRNVLPLRVRVIHFKDFPEHHGPCLFAFADGSIDCLHLPERKPERGSEARCVQEKRIDAGILPPAQEVLRRLAANPRLMPRNRSSFHEGDDPVGDDLVDVNFHGFFFLPSVPQ